MGKALRILVIVLAILSIAATVLAYLNFSKREALIGRAHILEETIVKIAGTFEADDPADVAQPEYPQRDVSPVTSRQLENPDRSQFWETYKNKFEPPAETPKMLNLGTGAARQQLRNLYAVDAEGKYVTDYNGKPTTEGSGTMKELLELAYTRSQKQYATLLATRAELPKLRDELISTIEELNAVKQEDRADKKTIEERDATIAQQKDEIASLNETIKQRENELAAAQAEIAEKAEDIAKLEEKVTELNDRIEQQEKIIRDLRGRSTLNAVQTVDGKLPEGTLTAGDKGKIVSFDEQLKFAVVEFSNEFMVELLGAQRDRPLPQVEVMVRQAGSENVDQSFVTRLRLRQAFQGKNLVIADILADWQQKPLTAGDIVFF